MIDIGGVTNGSLTTAVIWLLDLDLAPKAYRPPAQIGVACSIASGYSCAPEATADLNNNTFCHAPVPIMDSGPCMTHSLGGCSCA